MPEPRPSIFRRLLRPRLSVRVMMMVVLVVGGGLGWYIASARRQARTVAAIERIEGKAGRGVFYDWQYRDGKFTAWSDPFRPGIPMPSWLDWLLKNVEPDFFSNVTMIRITPSFFEDPSPDSVSKSWMEIDDDLAGRIGELRHLELLDLSDNPRFTDAHLAHLSNLTGLRSINLDGTGSTGSCFINLRNMINIEYAELNNIKAQDDDLANLSGLTRLKVLYLSGDKITDSGLAHLASLTNLESLSIGSGTKSMSITSKGLAYLAGLRRLERLEISSSKLKSLEPIRSFPILKHLDFSESNLDDQALSALSELEALEVLVLDGNPKITNAALIHLSGLKMLWELDLGGSSITDNDLETLAKFSSLKRTNLTGTKATPAGIAALKAKRPDIDVYYDAPNNAIGQPSP